MNYAPAESALTSCHWRVASLWVSLFAGAALGLGTSPAAGQGRPDVLWMKAGIGGEIKAAGFSPDGALIATAGTDGLVKLWRATDRSYVRALAPTNAGSGGISCLAFSPDGSSVAAGWGGDKARPWLDGSDTDIRLWRLVDGSQVATLQGHTKRLTALAISSNGTLLASASQDQSIKLWDLPAGTLRRSIGWVPTNAITALAFLADGVSLAVTSEDHVIRFIRISDGGLVYTWPPSPLAPTNVVTAVALSPDGTTIAVGMSSYTSNRFLVSGQTWAKLTFMDSIRLWDVAGGNWTATLAGRSAEELIGSLAFPTNDVPTPTELMDTALQAVRCLSFSPDGTGLAAGGGYCWLYRIKLWDVKTGAWVGTLSGHSDNVLALAQSTDRTRLLSWSHDQTWGHWALPSQSLLGTFTPVRQVPLAFSADGAVLAARGSELANGFRSRLPDAINFYRAREGTLTGSIVFSNDIPYGVCFNNQWTLMASAHPDGTIGIWDLETQTRLNTLVDFPDGQVVKVAFSPDGQFLASAGSRVDTSGGGYRLVPELHLWKQAGTWTKQGSFAQSNSVSGLVFSPDSQTLAESHAGPIGNTNTLGLWRVSDRTLLWAQPSPFNGLDTIGSIFFSPDGQRLQANGYFNLPIRRVSDGIIVQDISVPQEQISVAFAKDWSTAAQMTIDGRLTLLRIADGTVLRSYDQEASGSSIVLSAKADLYAYARGDAALVVASNPLAGGTAGSARLTMPSRLPNGSFQFQLLGDTTRTYRIEATSDFTNWTSVAAQITASNGPVLILDSWASNFSHRIYRAVSP